MGVDGGLTFDLCRELNDLGPGNELTLGRRADLVVDEDDRFVHRTAGCLRSELIGPTDSERAMSELIRPNARHRPPATIP